MRFEWVDTYEYLGMGLDTTSGGHEEVQRKTSAANICLLWNAETTFQVKNPIKKK